MSPRRAAGLFATLSLAAIGSMSTSTAAAAQTGQSGYVVTSDSARLFYRVIGHGADTIIAIHGGPGMDLESIAGDFAPLSAKHTVIFYDQRGGGKSTLPTDAATLGVKRQVQDLDDLRRHFGLARITLMAHSYGPLLAASYAIAHPQNVSRMVFFGPVPPRRGDFWQRYGQSINSRLDSTQRRAMAAAGRRMLDPAGDTRKACQEYWALGLRPRLAEPDRTIGLIKSDFCVTDPAGIRYGNRIANGAIMGSYGDWDLRDALRVVEAPTLIVHGEQESIPMDLVAEWVTALPHAQLLRTPRAAHFTYVERPELVWPAVERFLDGKSPF